MTARAIALCETWFDSAEAESVGRALAGRVAGNGPFGQRVEERLSALLAGQRVLLTTSCTHALELALMALGIGPGAEVVCPSFTFVSTANAILRVGARPVFADIDEETLGLDPADVAARVTPRTAALLPVHYGGIAPDMEGLLASRARARACGSSRTRPRGSPRRTAGAPLGTLGDAGCFSFHETKNVTCGEGGALAVADPEIAARAEIIREKGTNRSAFLRGEVDKYTWVDEGSSFILSDVLAAILDAQLDKLPQIQERRREVARRYRERLSGWAARTRGEDAGRAPRPRDQRSPVRADPARRPAARRVPRLPEGPRRHGDVPLRPAALLAVLAALRRRRPRRCP